MEISYNWLKEYVKFDLEPEALGQVLTDIGLEVEDMRTVESIPGGLKGVVVAKVLECVEHPNSDHLHITKVDTGSGDPIQVVCGAPNVAAGQKVLLATVGTSLPTPDGTDFTIKKSKIRGEESCGMICAEDELGIGSSHDGIMVLPEDAVVGTPAKEYLGLEEDTIFTIGLTPNRVDGACHIGVARDLSAWLRYNGKGGELSLPVATPLTAAEGESIAVDVQCVEGAPRYMGVTLTDVKVGPSPEWLAKRLTTVGLRPINNIVDITNYILMEWGQPLHAFDLAKVKGGKVVVRTAADGEKFVTLDGVEHTMCASDLMICNAQEPMCIAGVFGGLDSGITDSTTGVFLEIANFNPVYVRKTSKRHGIKTDASFRYERGVDPAIVPDVAARAVELICSLSGAKVVGSVRESYPRPVSKACVELDFARMEALIGKKIGSEAICCILDCLGYEFVSRSESGAVVLVPGRYVDVTRECDVVEEVLRIYGYNNIELPLQVRSSYNNSPKPDPETVTVKACDLLAANGFMECMNNSLTKADYYEGLKTFPRENLPIVINPLSSDLNAMRQTLIFSGLEVVAYNLNRQCPSLKLFELGNVYSFKPAAESENPVGELRSYSEHQSLAMFIVGKGTQLWRNLTGVGHFFALKGYVEMLLRRFGIDLYNLEYESAPSDIFAEGVEYRMGAKVIARMGAIAAPILKGFGIKVPVFAAEIDWREVLKVYSRQKVRYSELPRFPEVHRDLALLLDQSVSFADVRKCVLATDKKLIRSVTLFDVYEGDKIPAGKKQYAVSITIQDPDKTLTDQAVEALVKKVLGSLSHKLGAELR